MMHMIRLGFCIGTAVALLGCMTMRTNTKPPAIPDSEVRNLFVHDAVALRNAASESGEIIIGKWIGWRVYGDLHRFTESSIGAAKNVLDTRQIEVREDATKTLDLEVHEVKAEQGMVKFRATALLRVTTGSGVHTEYVGTHNYPNGYGTTFAIERALAQCVAKMLNDPNIADYLEK